MPSTIEWTDGTWNPLTGCTRVSPGCDHCYMFALYPRLKAMGVPVYDIAPDNIQLIPERLKIPLTWKRPRRVFVNSMADLFHPEVPFEFISKVFSTMREAGSRRGHVFQVLTKRPGRAVGWWLQDNTGFPEGWPPNVWIGTSVESPKYAPRLTVLARIPAPVWFVSAEPLLERTDLSPWLNDGAVAVGDCGWRKWPGSKSHGPRLGTGTPGSISSGWSTVLPETTRRSAQKTRRCSGHHRWAAVASIPSNGVKALG